MGTDNSKRQPLHSLETTVSGNLDDAIHITSQSNRQEGVE